MTDKFLYFSYGSNMLRERIHLVAPSATRKDIGKLNNYKLEFNYYGTKWHGTVASAVPQPGSIVWGAIWEVDETEKIELDKQGGVDRSIYKPINVIVETSRSDIIITCYAYELINVPTQATKDLDPEKWKPSLLYMKTLWKGAEESRLPADYIDRLRRIEHNGWDDANVEKLMVY